MNQKIEKIDDIYTVRMHGGNYGVMTSVHTVGSIDVTSIEDAVQAINKQGFLVTGIMTGLLTDTTYLIAKEL